MRRPGFTLLETVLAIAVGSLVLAAALSVMTTMRTSDRSLAAQSKQMNELAQTQLAVRRALGTLHTAPDDAISRVIPDPDQASAIRTTAFPDPIPGLAARLEMTTGTNPRLEAVLSRPLVEPPKTSGTGAPPPTLGSMGMLAEISAEQLPGHRGAFELRREEGAEHPALWWVPLPPRDLPPGVVFDAESLPPPHRLCRNVTGLTWTAFIDRQRVPLVRAIEESQLPAYIELEIETAGGAYGNWMFELGWTSGPEFDAPPELPDEGNAADDGSAEGVGGADQNEPADPTESGNPGQFDPEINQFRPEGPG